MLSEHFISRFLLLILNMAPMPSTLLSRPHSRNSSSSCQSMEFKPSSRLFRGHHLLLSMNSSTSLLWSPSLTVVVARQQYGRRHSLAQESRTRSSSLEHRSLITAFACRSLLSLEDESVLESDHTVVSECLESNNNKSYNMVSD